MSLIISDLQSGSPDRGDCAGLLFYPDDSLFPTAIISPCSASFTGDTKKAMETTYNSRVGHIQLTIINRYDDGFCL